MCRVSGAVKRSGLAFHHASSVASSGSATGPARSASVTSVQARSRVSVSQPAVCSTCPSGGAVAPVTARCSSSRASSIRT